MLTSFLALAVAQDDREEGRFVAFTPLSLEELYAKRMRFEAGEPIISVGIMDAQNRVRIMADGPTRLMFDEASLPKTVYSPPETAFEMRALGGSPAKLLHWVVVETRSYEDVRGADETRQAWESKGYAAKVFEAGTIVGLRGNVLDTRERRIGIGGFESKRRADELISRLSQKENLRPFVHEELVRAPRGSIGVYDGEGRLIHRASDAIYFGTIEGGRIQVRDVEHSRGYKGHGREDRSYWGHVYVVVDQRARLAVTNSVGAEALLKGLVPAEIFATAPIEALKAQAVTARGEIFSKLGHRHYGEPFHLCSEMHCQVYAGAGFERESTNRAVEETRGLLAVRPRSSDKDRLSLVDSVYSSTCGGFSEDNDVVWDNAPSQSLRSRIDGPADDPALAAFAGGLSEENIRRWLESYPPTACARSSFVNKEKFRWKRTFDAKAITRIGAALGTGAIRDVRIIGRGPGGRVKGLRVTGSLGTVDVVRELPVRRLFDNLSSGLFVLDIARDGAGFVKGLTFTGGGWGHGVGMCQVGAIGRAEKNHGFRQILEHYYNGATVVGIY